MHWVGRPLGIASGIALLLIGSAVGYAAGRGTAHFEDTGSIREGGYAYINPLIACDAGDETPDPRLDNLKRTLADAVSTVTADRSVTRASVYVREMDNGSWTGVHENEAYIPASLMKVPLAIAYFKELRIDPHLASTSVWIVGPDANTSETVRPALPLLLGKSYLAKEAVAAMLIQSDNNAAAAVRTVASSTTLADVYDLFGIPMVDETSEVMSPKVYMRLLRILYNASYLGRTYSEAALKLLTESSFKDGIVAGVPAGTPVAHKFGEREIASVDPVTGVRSLMKAEFHDCGIVYYPGHPYGICVMTEGTDLTSLIAASARLSAIVYDAAVAGAFGR